MHAGSQEGKRREPQDAPRWVTRISREAERRFFFYATVVMFLVWLGTELLGTGR